MPVHMFGQDLTQKTPRIYMIHVGRPIWGQMGVKYADRRTNHMPDLSSSLATTAVGRMGVRLVSSNVRTFQDPTTNI